MIDKKVSIPLYVMDAGNDVWKLWKSASEAYPEGVTQAVCLTDVSKHAWDFEANGPFRAMTPAAAQEIPGKRVLEVVGALEVEG